jgi:amino acid transporter
MGVKEMENFIQSIPVWVRIVVLAIVIIACLAYNQGEINDSDP